MNQRVLDSKKMLHRHTRWCMLLQGVGVGVEVGAHHVGGKKN